MWLHVWRVQLPSPVQSNGNLSWIVAKKKINKTSSRMMCDIIDTMCECDIKTTTLACKNVPHFDYLLVAFLSQNQKHTENNIKCIHLFVRLSVAYIFFSLSLFSPLSLYELIGTTVRERARSRTDYINSEIQIDLHYFIDMQIKASTKLD